VPGLLWAHGGVGTLPIPARARRDFADATHAVLRAVSDRLAPCHVYVGHVDRHADVLRLVDVTADELPRIEPGQSFRLDTAIDPAVLDGRIPQLAADGRAVSRDDAGAMTTILDAEGWACVPFAGPPGAPFATLTALVPDAGRLGEDELELLRDGAAILRDVLRAEHDEPERLLRELAWRDRVTGVLNAARFHELLETANSRNDGGAYLAHVSLSNFGTLADRMGQAVADLVRNDVARVLALQAESTDVIARVAATTFGCILPGRRAGEVEYLMRTVADQVAAAARRRGATAELRLGIERIGLGATSADAWQTATNGAQILR
jgi:diguanylate cyclase (GGDEF)-like protein